MWRRGRLFVVRVEEETMFRPVLGEVSARVQDEKPDHKGNEEQGVKEQPGDGQRHHFGETFFPALVWALHQGKRNRPADENIVQSVSSVIVGEEEESNGGDCDTKGIYADEEVCFIGEKAMKRAMLQVQKAEAEKQGRSGQLTTAFGEGYAPLALNLGLTSHA